MPDAASPLAGKRRGPESLSVAKSSGTAEAPSAGNLPLVPLTPDDSHAPSLRRNSSADVYAARQINLYNLFQAICELNHASYLCAHAANNSTCMQQVAFPLSMLDV